MPWVTETANNILREVLCNLAAVPPFPTTVWCGLSTTAPNLDGSNFTEVTSAQLSPYARQTITLSAPTARSTANTNLLNFATSAVILVPPFTVTHGGIFAASTGGTALAYGALATPLTINNGSLVQIPIGLLTITDPGT